jgi:hypothetical protein
MHPQGVRGKAAGERRWCLRFPTALKGLRAAVGSRTIRIFRGAVWRHTRRG